MNTKLTSRDAAFTGLETKAEESEEKITNGRSSKSTIKMIILKPHISFSVVPRASP